MPTEAQANLQELIRFLTKDAAVPLSTALTRTIPALQKAKLNTPDLIASVGLQSLQETLGETVENTPTSSFATEASSDSATTTSKTVPAKDQSIAKAVHNAAKRVSKKRKSGGASSSAGASSSKRGRRTASSAGSAPVDGETPVAAGARLEASLALPTVPAEDATDEKLRGVTLFTNRAPLVLAFAVQLLKYTMSQQPLSSRLSLAQAMVSLGAASKARHLGIARPGEEKAPEEEGWGAGQPVVRVMGRDVRVLKRVGYVWREKGEGTEGEAETSEEVPLWGLDLEALKKSNASSAHGGKSAHGSAAGLPIYTPQSAHNYIMKAFASAEKDESKKSSAKKEIEAKETNLALLLAALDKLYSHWSEKISKDELDRKAWQWYAHVRPDVAEGVAGWGGRGQVRLADILDLRR